MANVLRELPKIQSDGCTHCTVDSITDVVTSYGVLTVDGPLAKGSITSALSYIVERVPASTSAEADMRSILG